MLRQEVPHVFLVLGRGRLLLQPAGVGRSPRRTGKTKVRKTVLDNKDDNAAIHSLLERIVDGWNRGDAEAMAAVFDEDADYIVFNGIVLKGREQIAKVHQQLFDTVLKGTRLGGASQGEGGPGNTVRFLTPDVALVHSRGGVQKPGQSEASPEQYSIQTFVVVKRNGEWTIAAFQNTRIQPLQPAGGPTPQQ